MIDILYEFLYLPLSWQISAAVGLLFLVSWLKLPSIIITLAIGYACWLYEVDPVITGTVLAVLVVLTVPFVRQYTVSYLIMTLANKFGVFPKVSDTERAALEAGSVWMDKELFSGNPDIKKMMTQDIQGLSAEEQAFLAGPVTVLCSMVDDWEIQRTKQIPDHVWNYIKTKVFRNDHSQRAWWLGVIRHWS